MTVFIFSKSIQHQLDLFIRIIYLHLTEMVKSQVQTESSNLGLSKMPEHGLGAVLLDDVHRGPVSDQRDVSPDHIQGELVSDPDTVTLGLTSDDYYLQ